MKVKAIRWSLLAALAAFLAIPSAANAAVTVSTVPWDPCPTPACTTPANTPHTTYAITSTTEVTVILGATVPSAVGSADAFTYSWDFGDGSAPTAAKAVTNPYDISVTHQYPASAAVGTIWTAKVTVNDTTNSTSGSANYYVIQESNSCTTFNAQNQPLCVNSRANVAIDWGLWYMHQTMWRNNGGPGGTPWGGWDTQSTACNLVNGAAYDCLYAGAVNAENVQALEVNGHLQGGPSTDPLTDDVARGFARATSFIGQEAVTTDSYYYQPSTESYTCADHSLPQTTDLGACTGHGGRVYYNGSATTCPGATQAKPCVATYDGNKNSLMAYSNDGSGELSYTTSPFLELLVASQTPSAKVTTGPYTGSTFATVVQDIMDFYAYSQFGELCDVDSTSYSQQGRGNGSSCDGGAWLYSPQQGDDDSTSQWAAIGFISGFRGFGIPIPPAVTAGGSYPNAVTDFNNVWITNAQDLADPAPTGPNPFVSSDNEGAYGYRGAFNNSNAWGPFAVTPSAMVQMALDGIGRTKNTAFGDGTTDFDQRWNTTESFLADNFCNNVTTNPTASGNSYWDAYYAPRAYMYGLFSFTKSMLEHNEGGSLAAIQYLRTLTPSVFTSSTNPATPANTIDWYAALSSGSGGNDACDGVAQTLVNYQMTPANGTFDGHWYGTTSDVCYQGDCQSGFETAWALIMLKGTVFVQCVNNLSGRGTPGIGTTKPRIDLTWTNQANATSYVVSRSTSLGGPFTEVGVTDTTAFSDTTTGLINGDTYYYVVLPQINGAEVCQSNKATVKIPTR